MTLWGRMELLKLAGTRRIQDDTNPTWEITMHPVTLILYAICLGMLVLAFFVIKATKELRKSNDNSEREFQRWQAGDNRSSHGHTAANDTDPVK